MSISNFEKSPVGISSEEDVRQIRVCCAGRGKEYDIKVGAGLLARVGDEVRHALSPLARRIFIISNRKVFRLYGEQAVSNLQAEGFKETHWLMGDGERFKSLRTLEHVLHALAEFGMERNDAVLALGGGVVGDLAGLAASLYLRGIAFIQYPVADYSSRAD